MAALQARKVCSVVAPTVEEIGAACLLEGMDMENRGPLRLLGRLKAAIARHLSSHSPWGSRVDIAFAAVVILAVVGHPRLVFAARRALRPPGRDEASHGPSH